MSPYAPGCCAERNRHCICCNARPEERLHEARPPSRRTAGRGRRRRDGLRTPGVRQLLLRQGREERHPARLAVPGGQQQAEGEGRRRGPRRLREGARGHEGHRGVHPGRDPRPAHQGRLQRPEERPRRRRVRQHRHRRLREGRRTRGHIRGVRGLGRGQGRRLHRPPVGHRGRKGLRRPLLRRRPRPLLPHRRLRRTRPQGPQDAGRTGVHRQAGPGREARPLRPRGRRRLHLRRDAVHLGQRR